MKAPSLQREIAGKDYDKSQRRLKHIKLLAGNNQVLNTSEIIFIIIKKSQFINS